MATAEYCGQFLRWNDFKLRVGTVGRLFIRTPSSKLRGMTEPVSLHGIVRDFNHEFGPERFPPQVLSLAPAALCSRYAASRLTHRGFVLRPMFPGMTLQRVFAIWREVLHEFAALLSRKAAAHANVLQSAGTI